MSLLTLLGIAVGLAMDAFAISIAAGLTLAPVSPRQMFRLAFHFGLFQFTMPVVGWFAGRGLILQVDVGAYDHWVAFGLLALVGGKMLLDAADQSQGENKADPSRGLMLVTLSVATSIDALAVGLSMAILRDSVWTAAVVIGLVAAGLSAVGIGFGARLGRRWGRWADVAGGCLLILIGLKILVEHLSA